MAVDTILKSTLPVEPPLWELNSQSISSNQIIYTFVGGVSTYKGVVYSWVGGMHAKCRLDSHWIRELNAPFIFTHNGLLQTKAEHCITDEDFKSLIISTDKGPDTHYS